MRGVVFCTEITQLEGGVSVYEITHRGGVVSWLCRFTVFVSQRNQS